MPLSAKELKSLVVALGVNVPGEIITQREQSEEFYKRLEKLPPEASKKPEAWSFRPAFETCVQQAKEDALKGNFGAGLRRLETAEEFLRCDSGPNADAPLVTLQTCKMEWIDLRKNVEGQLQTLEKAIVSAIKVHNAVPLGQITVR